MPSFNRVMLIGHLTRDPQTKQLPGGTTVAEFGLATNRKYKTATGEEREDVLFVDCAVFGKQADTVAKYCQKGKALFVEGRLKFDQWEDKQNGGKRSKISVVVEGFQFLGAPGGGEAAGDDPDQRRAPARAAAGGRRPTPEPPFGDAPEMDPDDIPFNWAGRVGQPL